MMEDGISDFNGINRASRNENWKEYFFEETKWEVRPRYTELLPLGKGAYGLVCSANDSERVMQVAIKKLARPFETTIHAKRAYREIRLLKHVSHDNVIKLLVINYS